MWKAKHHVLAMVAILSFTFQSCCILSFHSLSSFLVLFHNLYTHIKSYNPAKTFSNCSFFFQVKSSGIRVGSTKRKRSERKVTRMVSIVVAVFVLCWLPFYIFNVTSVTGSIKPTSAVKSTFDFVVVLGYTNSCANPILYAFLSDNFKKSFQNVLCLKKVTGLDEMERSDSRADRSRMAHDAAIINANLEVHNTALLNGELQTSI